VALSVDTRKIVHATVIPWELDDRIYGIAYILIDGQEGAERIGTEKEAERIVRDIRRQRLTA
jgi:hypothetical protein